MSRPDPLATAMPLRARLGALRRMPLLRLGLIGQTLTFAAMVVPILGRANDQVLVLVFASSVALLLVNAGMLAYPFVYPVVRGPRMARVATVWSLVVLAVVSAAITLLTPLEDRLGLPGGTFAAAAAVTAGWGTFSVMTTRLVRVGDDTGIGLSRVYYGTLTFLAAVAATLADPGPLGLTLGHALAYLLAAALLLGRRSHHGPALPRLPRAARRRLRRAWFARTAQPTAASLAGGWTAVIPGLVIPGLGPAAEPWAVVSRICGGFATVMVSLIAPPLEARLSRAVRDRDAAAWSTGRRTALTVGVASGTCGVVGGLALALYATDDAGQWFVPVAVATVLFWGSLLAGTLLNQLPNFLGRDGQRLLWDLGRAVAVTAAFLLVAGPGRLVAMGAVLAASAWLLLPMTRWNRRER